MKIQQFIRQNHSASTTENYLFEIQHFLETNPRARYYKHADIVKWAEGLIDRYPVVATRIRKLSAIKQYYYYLVFTGKRCDHPCNHLSIKRKRCPIQTQNLFTPDELSLLHNRPNRYKHLDCRNTVVISLLINQGITSRELTELNTTDVDIDSARITIKGSRTIAGRQLQLTDEQVTMLETYLEQVRPKLIKSNTRRLILGKQGLPISVDGINSIIETCKPLFPHKTLNPETIRMSVIANWLNLKKFPVEEVLDLSGLKWASSAMAYKSLNIDYGRELLNRLHPLR